MNDPDVVHSDVRAGSRPMIVLRDVGVTMQGVRALDGVTLSIDDREHLAVLGPNGAGKTTLLRVLSTFRYPTRGHVEVLGTVFGKADLRPLRSQVGLVSVSLDPLLHERAHALPLVAAARTGATWPPADVLDDPKVRIAAQDALARVGASRLSFRRVDTLSQGERQRVRIARALVAEPRILLLDEPFAGLDLGGRESLIADLDRLLAEPDGPTIVMVTHHVEELPTGILAAALMNRGKVVEAGPVGEVLTDERVSATFGVPVAVTMTDGRWRATVVASSSSTGSVVPCALGG